MIHEAKIPKLDVNEDFVILGEWYVKEGDYVNEGTPLCSIETSKTVTDLIAETSGYVKCLRYEVGDEIPIQEVICYIVDSIDTEIPSDLIGKKDKTSYKSVSAIHATDKAQKLAKKLSIDISKIPKKGVIRKKDVLKFHKSISKDNNDNNQESTIAVSEHKREKIRASVQQKNSKKVAVYGAGPHGILVKDIIDSLPDREFFGFLDAKKPAGMLISNGVIVGNRSFIRELRNEGVNEIYVSVFDRHLREELNIECRENGLELFTVLHPEAIIADDVKIEEGCFIKAGAIVDSHSTIGEGTIIDNGCVVAHHCKIGRYCHLTPGVVMGGEVIIGDYTLIAIGSSIMSKIEIGENCWVEIGSVVKSSFTKKNLFIGGQPAKIKPKQRLQLGRKSRKK